MSAIQKVMETVVRHLPDSLVPGAKPDPLAGASRVLGRPIPRVDGPRKVTGAARFSAEVTREGMTYAALVGSTIARGRIVEIDVAEAERAAGVVLVMTYRNAPRLRPPPMGMIDQRSASTSNLPVMQDASIHWNGEPVAVILAERQEQADHAATLVRVTYEAEEAQVDFGAAKAGAKPPPTILGEPAEVEIGHAEAALKDAACVVDRTYRTPRHHHSAIELHAATVAWEADGSLTLDTASQMINATIYTLGQVFGLADDQIRVRAPFVGGGFGGKTLWSHEILAAAAAKLAQRPVRMVLSREGVFRVAGFRTLSEQRVALGADPEGRLISLIHEGVTAVVSHNAFPEQFSFPARHLYAAKNLRAAQKTVELDTVANTSMRAPGESIGTFALECAMDELAEALGLDPIELRIRNEPERDPSKGTPFSSRHFVEACRRGAEAFGWEARNRTPGGRREGEWLVGQGFGAGTYPYYRMPGGTARIRLTADGRAIVSMASHEMGMGTATVQAQHAAERLGLPMERVTFEYGDTALPAGTMAGGSSQTVSIAAAVIAAHEALVKELLALAGKDSPLAGLKPDEVEAHESGLRGIKERGRLESYVSILARAGRDELVAEAEAPAPLEVMHYSMHSFAAQFCEVRVNAVTGEVRVARFLGSFDTGRILNAQTAASQFRGGIIMGLGLALTEEALFDERTGRFMNPSLAEYHVPVHADVPAIDVIWTDIPDPHTPLGAHGIGEIGITGVGAAVANAIYNATGKRVRELPITLDKVADLTGPPTRG